MPTTVLPTQATLIYNSEATKDAYEHTIAFLKPRLK